MTQTRQGVGSGGATSFFLLLTVGLAGLAKADERMANNNPLRSGARSDQASSATARSAPIGTSVRRGGSPASRTPASTTAASAPRRASSGRTNQVTQASYGQRMVGSRSAVSAGTMPPPGQFLSETSVLQGTVTTQPQPEILAHPSEQPAEIFDGEWSHGEFLGEYVDGGGCGGCGQCNECCLVPCPQLCLDDLSIFGGVQGFTGPKNRGSSGSFGFYEGFNWGSPLPCFTGCVSMQAGARFTQSSMSGTGFTPDSRNQVFLTAGLFRRVDWGLQGGIAFDYLVDDWYTSTKLTQLRGEIGWVFPCAHELGFWMTASTNEELTGSTLFTGGVPATVNERWEATDLYTFYYRHRFEDWSGAVARGYAGFTGSGDGLIGADFRVALGCNLSLETGFTYLVPKQSKGPTGIGNEEESWNVAVGLVWYPGANNSAGCSYNSPLFNVADNGSFMVDQVR